MATVKLFQSATARTCLCLLENVTKSYCKLWQVFGGLIEFNFKLHRLFQTATNFILKCGCYRKVVTIQRYSLESFFIAEIFSRTSIMKSYIMKFSRKW